MRGRVALVGGALLLTACATTPPAPPPPLVPVVLDLDDPVVDAVIAGVTLRLRVDLFQKRDVVELNPEAAARLPLKYEPGFDYAIGRVGLKGRQAAAIVTIGGIDVATAVAEHGRACCTGVDGAISASLMPNDPVRFVRAGVAAGTTRRLAVTDDNDWGLSVDEPVGRDVVHVLLAMDHDATIATASAGAILAAAYGGRLEGASFVVTPAFGVERQARTMRFAQAPRIAGFAVASVAVRFADFSGRRALPVEAGGEDAIEVRGHAPPPMRDWPSVSLGRAQLDRCREIAFHKAEQAITLDCRFDP